MRKIKIQSILTVVFEKDSFGGDPVDREEEAVAVVLHSNDEDKYSKYNL